MSSPSGSPGLSDVCATVLLPSSSCVLKAEHCSSFNRKHQCSWATLFCFLCVQWHLLLGELPFWSLTSVNCFGIHAISWWITKKLGEMEDWRCQILDLATGKSFEEDLFHLWYIASVCSRSHVLVGSICREVGLGNCSLAPSAVYEILIPSHDYMCNFFIKSQHKKQMYF